MKKLWGSRFSGNLSHLAEKFTFSISYDHKLAIYDVIGSIAHAEMLGEQKIIPQTDARKIIQGLKKIGRQISDGKFQFNPKAEDIHTNIQQALKKLIGKPADKLHTARSRNDQVVLDMKMYCLNEIADLVILLTELQKSILRFAKKNEKVIVPAYTHLQAAQVVLLAHHMLAYIEMLQRDKTRLEDAFMRMDTMPLGSCALSGTTLSTNRKKLTKKLGFAETTRNSIDSVSDRDFIVELLADLSILGMHLSRMCEDLIIWVTAEFNFIRIDDAFCTGSSIMPHKKNPDVLELVRAATAKFPARLSELLIMLKGLPLTYNRDLQLDKPALFESVETCKDTLELMSELFGGITINKGVLNNRTQDEYFFSVDLMEHLIRKGVSYREAHDTVGRIVKNCLDQGEKISALSEKDLKKYSQHFDQTVKKLLNPQGSVERKKSFGSTNPKLVNEQLRFWQKQLS